MRSTLELYSETPVASGIRVAFGELEVAGWVRGPDLVSTVDVELAGHRTRAEVAPAGPEAPTRFRVRLSVDNLPRGPAVLEIHARDTAGREASLRTEIELQPFDSPTPEVSFADMAATGPLVVCDQPRLDLAEPLETPGTFTGWAYAPEGIYRVVVVIDRRTAHEAVTALWRGDVARELGRSDATDSGWLLELPPDACPPGEHEVAVIAIAHSGRAMGRVGTVTAVDPAAPASDGPLVHNPSRAAGTGPARPLGDRPRERVAGELETPAEHRELVCDLERSAVYRWVTPLAAGASVLDVGCPDGLGREILEPAGAAMVLESERPTVAPLPCGDGSFDLILAVGHVYEAAELAAELPELRRALRPEGVLVVTGRGVGEALEEFSHMITAGWRIRLGAEVAEAHDTVPPSLSPWRDAGSDALEVAAASQRALPRLPRAVVNSGALDLEPWRTLAATWTERALRAEAELEAFEIDAARSQHHAQLTAIRLLASEREREALEARLHGSKYSLPRRLITRVRRKS